jgi:hypothetical protein
MTTDFSSFALTPNERAAASLLDAAQLDPRAANLISFLNKEPFANLIGEFNKISPEGLSAFYEISFSNANIQRLNLESRLDDIHHGSSGFSSNMKVNGATVNLEDRVDADGKSSKAIVEPILQPGPENRWGSQAAVSMSIPDEAGCMRPGTTTVFTSMRPSMAGTTTTLPAAPLCKDWPPVKPGEPS